MQRTQLIGYCYYYSNTTAAPTCKYYHDDSYSMLTFISNMYNFMCISSAGLDKRTFDIYGDRHSYGEKFVRIFSSAVIKR